MHVKMIALKYVPLTTAMTHKRQKSKSAPRAFISYSWGDDKEWIESLANQLTGDGVDVKLDKWAVAPGDQLPQFREQAVRDGDFILIICTPGYKQKSEARTGGGGHEGHITTAELMTKQNDRKFIPILQSGRAKDALPSWLLGKRYIDLSDPATAATNYAELVQTLHGQRPERPPIGKAPKPGKSRSRPATFILKPNQLAT